MNLTLRNVHRYVSLSIALIWLIQALSGLVLVFGRELDEWGSKAPIHALEPVAFGQGIERLQAQHADQKVTYVMATGGAPDRYDVLMYGGAEGDSYVRLDGVGNILRERPYDRAYPQPGLFFTTLSLHQTFFSGDKGIVFIGISGLLLLTNLILGLKLAWPRAGQWARVMLPGRAPRVGGAAALYVWHRRVGLWLALPAMMLVFAGVMMAIGEPIQDWAKGNVEPPSTEAFQRDCPKGCETVISPAQAITTAMAQFPAAQFTLLQLPDAETPWYRIRLRQADDLRRVLGTTLVYIDKRDGSVLGVREPAKLSGSINFFNSLFPVHTGEIAGTGGRWFVFAIGLWLVTMIGLGISLWWKRRRPSRN